MAFRQLEQTMELEWMPLLQRQRDLYNLPRGPGRFATYLQTLMTEDRSDVALPPLVAMNPMGKEHVAARLDELLAMGAEEVAAAAVAAADVQTAPGSFQLGLVVADDLMGGWTNRYASEFRARFELADLKRGWISVVWWVSETPSVGRVQEAVLAAVYRAAYVQQYGLARTLGDMLRQEGYATARAGCQEPRLEAEDLAYTREVIAPYLTSQEHPTVMACLFGDEAARALGYPLLGLSHRAGLALALHEGRLGTEQN